MFNHSYVTGGFRAGVQVQRKVNLVWDNLKVHSEVRAAASRRRVRLTGGHLLFFFSLLVFSPLMCKQRENVTSNELGICCAHANLGLANCKQSNILWLSLSTHSLLWRAWRNTHRKAKTSTSWRQPGCPQELQGPQGGPEGRPRANMLALMHSGPQDPGLLRRCLTAVSQHTFMFSAPPHSLSKHSRK